MKILFVHNYYPVIGGGEDSVVEEECCMLKHAGHTVVTFFMYTKERNLQDFIFCALCLIWNPVAYRKMRRILQSEQPDVVHSHNTFPLVSPSIYWACKKEGVPVVQTLHNYRLICANGLFLRQGSICEVCSKKAFAWPAIRYRCYRNSLLGSTLMVLMQSIHRLLGTWEKKVDTYIALTEFSKSRFVKSGVLPEKRIFVKPNFISDRLMALKSLTKKKQVVFVGRLSPEKGCLLLIEAWIKAFQKTSGLSDYELLVVGDGPERRSAEELCNLFPKKFSIHFIGILSRTNILKILQNSRFLVLPSIWYEGFPMVIVEAFACGIPVLSAELGSMLSIVENNKTGLFFEVGNVNQLADKIVWAVTHEENMEQMGQAARHQFLREYSVLPNSRQLMYIYRELK